MGTSTRPSSEQVRDLHVYVIPPELWRQHLRSAANEVITDSISLGFLRIPPHIHLHELRREIMAQLGDEYLPKDYAFLKSVGRCLTQVKSRQEHELKVKHFLPPYAYAPELYILDAHAESMRDSPSTIFQHSLSGTALPKTGSKTGSAGYHNGHQTSSNHPSSQHGATTPLSSGAPTYRAAPRIGAEDNQFHSQVFDQPTNNSSYPAYSNPYSHDISALTNAHRNQVNINSSRTFDTYGGADTYRKYNDDSSGYKSMPSPKKLSESPTRLYHGDNTMTRKLNHRSPTHGDSEHTSHSPQTVRASHKTSPLSSNQQDAVLRGRNSSFSPEHRNGTHSSSSPERSKIHSDEQHKNWADNVDASPPNYDRQTGEREMMSATPNASPTRHHIADSNVYNPDQKDHPDDVLERDDYDQSSNIQDKENQLTKEKSAASKEQRELIAQLQQARDERLLTEKKREELVKKARTMQAKTNNRRNQAREVWKKKYYEAKKQTPSLESDCQRLRNELDSIHKKYLTALENSQVDGKQKENYPLETAKLQYDVDELQRKADAAKMKLTAEMKLRNQAETELRALRAELTQKKMNMNLSRAQKINSIGNSVLSISSQP